ncbi:ATP/GTP-binding site motif A (P-loop):ABC transporter:AAA ATPase [Fulvimarina pelagi HTCC2506]|uniref:ATP/GTP-binding site motif A (P-loop):ABC transporter:AAA ATPase n=1 Tax=Fulvimarina pelagi HTCC2506 TaxID=314231 RepID=Q0G348_9HYPH|nr:ATP-binding cassette domain-containing protein [Fulvimarina pelagi]EAU41983.1 ATP/GTP-binding site motif A (P-loop):ABC transporter:AAA ATPase [Fulvimarina pelagi HTCC2506]
MIEAAGISKRYGRSLVVDDVDLELPASGLTAIIGPNGAGKSTLLSMIARLLPMDAGQARVAGLDVAKAPSDELARRLAILRQENVVVSRLTVRDLVGFGRFPHSRGRMSAADREKVEEAIGFLGLHEFAERFLDEMSGGQRQRAFVAMALAQDTDVILLDEPLNNLDIRHAVEIMRLMRRAADERGKTVVVVIHDINFAAAYADRIVAMKNGRIACQGPVREVVTEPIIGEIFGLAVIVREIDGQVTCLFQK